MQKGLAASTFIIFEGLGYGFGSVIVAFAYEARVAGVTMAAVPVLVIAASVCMYIAVEGAKIVNNAYGQAHSILNPT